MSLGRRNYALMRTRTAPALPRIEPVVPTLRPAPFNDPAWLFEPKYDGFRGLVYLTGGRCTIYSKRGNKFSRFRQLEARLCGAFPKRGVILDGEVVAFGPDGRVSFWHLMRGEGTLGYVAFDILWLRGKDLRQLPLIERKKRLKRLLPEAGARSTSSPGLTRMAASCSKRRASTISRDSGQAEGGSLRG